jgi:hypothetical protein
VFASSAGRLPEVDAAIDLAEADLRAVVADVPDEWLTPVPGVETPEALRDVYVAFLSARLATRTWLPRASAA